MPLTDREWSVATSVNEFGIASGNHGGGDFMHGVAVQLH
jgi:hypothetical protein